MKLLFNENRLDYGVPHLATLSVRSLITQADANFNVLGFQLLKTQQVYLISQFLISRVYITVLNSPNAPSYLHQAMQTQKTCTEKDLTRPRFQL